MSKKRNAAQRNATQKKFKLDDLEVQSFVTSKKSEIKGGLTGNCGTGLNFSCPVIVCDPNTAFTCVANGACGNVVSDECPTAECGEE